MTRAKPVYSTKAFITIDEVPGFGQWRAAARRCLQNGLHPDEIQWRTGESAVAPMLDLFSAQAPQEQPENTSVNGSVKVHQKFITLAEVASCHHNPDRFSLLYRLLWRQQREGSHLLARATDDDVLAFQKLVKAVYRDAYKIKAYLRFREVRQPAADTGKPQAGDDAVTQYAAQYFAQYVAWYEPEHYSLELVLPFFTTRFKNMRWSILTPYRAAHWDGESLQFADNPESSLYPKDDAIEQYWLTYYASIFNPARVKTKAMLSQMPKKYWKNMPETVLIDQMLRGAGTRLSKMLLSNAT
ncbi:MAG: TIGR03915 family putative DNA repair protein [Vampirovibrionales bacterium]|nr:TIGR03915 family putative DNA repair protein [Vampirovibrionales bacterium]